MAKKVKAKLKTRVQKPVKVEPSEVSVAEIVCILDRSGSMSGVVQATIEGFNGFIQEQKDLGPGQATLVLFDTEYELVYENMALDDVPELTTDVYFTRGGTALLDAVGLTISKVRERHLKDQPEQTLFMIITDGYENSSKEYTEEGRVKRMVKECLDDQGWKFFFLGAGIDVFAEAAAIGIPQAFAAEMKGGYAGTQHAYATASAAMSMSRTGKGDLGGAEGQTMSDLYEDEEQDSGDTPSQ